MFAMKFGSTGQEYQTWAMNSFLPGLVALKYRRSRIVAFSTGNVYGLVPVSRGGSTETDPPRPVGEYAMSCLGRERILEHFSRTMGIPMALIRLNYAVEMRYGVLVDLARKVLAGRPIDLAMGYFNVIWQADANAIALRAFDHAATPTHGAQRHGAGNARRPPGGRAVRRAIRPAGRISRARRHPTLCSATPPSAAASSALPGSGPAA